MTPKYLTVFACAFLSTMGVFVIFLAALSEPENYGTWIISLPWLMVVSIVSLTWFLFLENRIG